MKKVILLSTVLGLGALGMACGEAANNANTNKPANTNVAPVSSPVAVSSPVTNTAPANNANAMKPATNATNANAKPANANANANKK